MNQLSNFISQYLKTCETIKKIRFQNTQSIPYRLITISYIYAIPKRFHRKKTLNSFLSQLHTKYKPKTAKRKIATLCTDPQKLDLKI